MKRALVIVAAVLAVVAFFGISASLRQGDDATMIKETLRQSLEASRKGEPGKVLEAISSSITVNNEDPGGIRRRVASYIRDNKPDIEVVNTNPIITGDEARITSPVKMRVSVPLFGEHAGVIKDVVLVFRKETARKYLIFPVKAWRLSEVQAPPFSLDTFGFE